MGVVHHSNYLRYFEVARLEWLTQLGVSYAEMERAGVMMPVIEANIQFKTPARFEDTLRVHIHLDAVPLVKMRFDYRVYNQHNVLVCEAMTTLAFMRSDSRKPMRCPAQFQAVFKKVIDAATLDDASLDA